jgi:hypothetical protein
MVGKLLIMGFRGPIIIETNYLPSIQPREEASRVPPKEPPQCPRPQPHIPRRDRLGAAARCPGPSPTPPAVSLPVRAPKAMVSQGSRVRVRGQRLTLDTLSLFPSFPLSLFPSQRDASGHRVTHALVSYRLCENLRHFSHRLSGSVPLGQDRLSASPPQWLRLSIASHPGSHSTPLFCPPPPPSLSPPTHLQCIPKPSFHHLSSPSISLSLPGPAPKSPLPSRAT